MLYGALVVTSLSGQPTWDPIKPVTKYEWGPCGAHIDTHMGPRVRKWVVQIRSSIANDTASTHC